MIVSYITKFHRHICWHGAVPWVVVVIVLKCLCWRVVVCYVVKFSWRSDNGAVGSRIMVFMVDRAGWR